ncbi:hypothetical protein KKF69_08400 [Patescibacteria group bacterium]|nr:hypothetical protein [Patescibacteria group bacterium]
MSNILHHLYTASEAEELFGKKYFYRQRIYRLAANKKIIAFNRKENTVYLGTHIVQAFLKELELRIQYKFPEIDINSIRVFYDTVKGKRIVIDGLLGRSISANTDEETEEDLLKKIASIIEWISSEAAITKEADTKRHDSYIVSNTKLKKNNSITEVLPEEILWVRLDTGIVQGVEVKSYILVSLPTLAQFVGVRTDNLVQWISNTTFSDFILSAHYKQIRSTENSVPWKKGVMSGYTPFIPFELLPEILIALRQSRNTPEYPEKAQMLYDLAKNTLQAVGIAISGDKNKAAEELARVGLGLGLTAADQIIGIFKQYESREFQVQTTKEFQSKIKALKMDYATTIGTLTLGITRRWPSQWKALGVSKRLPKTITTSSREVMRQLSPSDGVGMTFGEKHFTKDPKIAEAVTTGKQGKEFYERLKKVGLLD